MPCRQLAGELDVSGDHRPGQRRVLFLTSTTQLCAERFGPQALVYLEVQLQAQVVPEAVMRGPGDRFVQCPVRSLGVFFFAAAGQIVLGPSLDGLAVLFGRSFRRQPADLLFDRAAEVEELVEPRPARQKGTADHGGGVG